MRTRLCFSTRTLVTGQTFQSATAFSIYCKRLQTPGKQGDDGWKSVHYEGVPLGDIRTRFMERFPDGTIPAHAIPSAAPTAASSRVMADTDTSRDSVEAADEDDVDDVMEDVGAAPAVVRDRLWCSVHVLQSCVRGVIQRAVKGATLSYHTGGNGQRPVGAV